MDTNEFSALRHSDRDKSSEKEANANIVDLKAQVGKNIERETSFVVSAEVFQKLFDELTEKKPKSKLASISNNSLIVGIICLLLGGYMTAIYSSQQRILDYAQQELIRKRDFSDELRKISIQKFGEVWERFDENELAIDNMLTDGEERSALTPQSRFEEVQRLIHEDRVILNKNRFWIGEKLYTLADSYLNLSIKYALNKLLGTDVDNLRELIRQRDAAKQDILQIRKLFLEEESANQSQMK